MHELSVAQNIIDIVKENVPSDELSNVKSILIDVGEMSGVVADSLEFCFDVVKLETPLQNSRIEIKKIPFILFCNSCNKDTSNTMGIRMCEYCGGFDTKIISGTEMNVTEVELNS
jgi:hydrogenase nickel incorporation protein HypA/HybF